jgi:hypothetical protein
MVTLDDPEVMGRVNIACTARSGRPGDRACPAEKVRSHLAALSRLERPPRAPRSYWRDPTDPSTRDRLRQQHPGAVLQALVATCVCDKADELLNYGELLFPIERSGVRENLHTLT